MADSRLTADVERGDGDSYEAGSPSAASSKGNLTRGGPASARQPSVTKVKKKANEDVRGKLPAAPKARYRPDAKLKEAMEMIQELQSRVDAQDKELQKKAEAQHREMQNLEGELQRKAEAQHREMQILEGKVEAMSERSEEESESPTGTGKARKRKAGTKEEGFALKHGKFLTDGSVQQFVYIPAADSADIAAKSPELFDMILRHWNLPRPHLLIKFQSGFAHPKHLLDEDEIAKLKEQNQRGVSSDIYGYYMHFRNFAEQNLNKKEAQERNTLQQKTEGSQEAQVQNQDDIGKNDGKERPPSVEGKKEKLLEAHTLKLLNDFLYKSLRNLIDVIVRACVRNRCWIMVEGGPTGGLLLLKQAAERCHERPIILVVDSFNKKRYPYKKVREFVEKETKEGKGAHEASTSPVPSLAQIRSLHELLDDKGHVKKGDSTENIVNGLVKHWDEVESKKLQQGSEKDEKNKEENQKPWTEEEKKKFQESRLQSALMTTQLLESAQPINQPVVKPLKLDMTFWDLKSEEKGWSCKSHKDPEAKKENWNHWHFRGGTHYIFCDDHHHSLVLNCLAPSGCIFLGGGDNCKEELLKMLINGQPVVCLNNTGRVTQDFVRCHDFLCSQLFRMSKPDEDKHKGKPRDKTRPGLSRSMASRQLEAAMPKETRKVEFYRDRIERKTMHKQLTFDSEHGVERRKHLVENMDQTLGEVNQFTQPEKCELLMTYLRRGLQITKLCVVMDPLNPRECSGGYTEDKLSMCLSNFVILASNDTSDFADVEAVKAASELKKQLEGAGVIERRWAVSMVYLLSLLNLLSLLLALGQSGQSAGGTDSMPANNATTSTATSFSDLVSDPIRILDWLPDGVLFWGLPAVSALSTFISGLVARFRFTLRWSKALSAAANLEAEIWKFRTRVSDYVVVGVSNPSSVTEEERAASKMDTEQVVTRERKQDEARTLFRSNVNNIFNTAMEEMGTSSLHNGFNDTLPSRQKAKKSHDDEEPRSRQWSWQCCWRSSPESHDDEEPRSRQWSWQCCWRSSPERSQRDGQDLEGGLLKSLGNQVPETEDLTLYGHIGIDDYYHQRTLDVLERMKNQAFWLTFKQGALESFVLLFGTAGVLLSTFGQTELAMVTVSLAATLQSLERFHALSNRLDAANAGERDMICAWQDWSAMEPMQRRFQTNVSRLVLTTEGVSVALTSAATAGVRQSLVKKPN